MELSWGDYQQFLKDPDVWGMPGSREEGYLDDEVLETPASIGEGQPLMWVMMDGSMEDTLTPEARVRVTSGVAHLWEDAHDTLVRHDLVEVTQYWCDQRQAKASAKALAQALDEPASVRPRARL